MKTYKIIIAATTALLLAAPVQAAAPAPKINLSQVASALTSQNGINAGRALLGLYTQFKADGKFNFQNANNITNLLTLANSIQGLKNGTENVNTTNFLSGLISGSNNLVNKSNSTNVLGALTSLANVDMSSLAGNVAQTAASNAAGSLLSKIGGSSASSTTETNDATNAASSILGGLFNSFLK